MPIYEEKVISPLAVRFTQNRIRPTFRDGHDVETTIKQVVAGAGVGDYDIILEAPFPCIEMIRWSANGRGRGRKDHWFTFDNRRLYCLQRAAAEYWPKRVGVAVQVLYADAGSIRKKLDSRTQGLSVNIGHAFATDDELTTWSWREAVRGRAPPGLEVSSEAESAILADDAKASVTDLMEAPTASTSLTNAGSNVEPIPKGAAIHAAEASPSQGSTLTNLIGQLLDLKTMESVQSCEYMSEGSFSTSSQFDSVNDESAESDLFTLPPAVAQSLEPSMAAPPGLFFPAKADASALTTGTADVFKEGSLTSLIGQLLVLDKQECNTRSPSFSLCSESAETDVVTPKSTMFRPVLAEASEVYPGDEEFKAMQELKQARSEAAQAEYAMKMVQWQRAQWQAAQMAQLQTQAAQMAQFQAMRARQTMSFYAQAALMQQTNQQIMRAK